MGNRGGAGGGGWGGRRRRGARHRWQTGAAHAGRVGRGSGVAAAERAAPRRGGGAGDRTRRRRSGGRYVHLCHEGGLLHRLTVSPVPGRAREGASLAPDAEADRMKAVTWHGKRDVRVESVPD